MGFIRFLLAIAVVIVHSSPVFGFKLMGGDVAVQSFYIISGFYMSLILNEKYVGKNAINLFISNRFLRLYPTYLFVTICAIALSLVYGMFLGSYGVFQHYIEGYNKGTISISTILLVALVNITLIGQDILSFFTLDKNTGNLFFSIAAYNEYQPFLPGYIGLAWTISVEFMFYFLAPFLIRQGLVRIIIGVIISIAIRYFFYIIGFGSYIWLYRCFLTEIVFFLMGGLSYQFYIYLKRHNYLAQANKIVLIFVTLYSILSGYLIDSQNPWNIGFNSKFTYFFILTLSIPFLFHATKSSEWDRFLGELSYPIYLSHVFLLMIVGANRFPIFESKGTTLLIITIIFFYLIHRFIEKPIDNFRQKRLQKTSIC